MPGRTPKEAFDAFVTPLMEAMGCIVRTKFEIGGGKMTDVDAVRQISLTGQQERHIPTSGRVLFRARMMYKIITDDRKGYGPFRVTTIAYDHSLQHPGGEALLAYHWHPQGKSHELTPHLHLGAHVLQPEGVLSGKDHLLTGRVTFEMAVRMAIRLGAKPIVPDWESRLAGTEGPHILYRTWS